VEVTNCIGKKCVHIHIGRNREKEREILHVDLLEGRGKQEGRFRRIFQYDSENLVFYNSPSDKFYHYA